MTIDEAISHALEVAEQEEWNNEGCEMSCRFAWIHTDEALKLIGEDEDENS